MRTLETEKGQVTIHEAFMERRSGYGCYFIHVNFNIKNDFSHLNTRKVTIDTPDSELWDNCPDDADDCTEYLLNEAFYSIVLAIEKSIDDDLSI